MRDTEDAKLALSPARTEHPSRSLFIGKADLILFIDAPGMVKRPRTWHHTKVKSTNNASRAPQGRGLSTRKDQKRCASDEKVHHPTRCCNGAAAGAAFTSPRRPKVTNAQLYYNCSERARALAGIWAV